MTKPAVRVIGSPDGAWEVLMENPQAIGDAIGVDVLAAFFKCFSAVERVTSIEHLMFINYEHSQKPDIGRSIAVQRNENMLMLMMAGVMYEFGIALQHLQSTKVVVNLKDRTAWEPLNEMRKHWTNDDMANKIRNGFAFHLGDLEAYKRGIAKLPDVVPFQKGHGRRRGSDRFIAPYDALLLGEGIMDDEITPYLQRMSKDHLRLRQQMFDFFASVMAESGVPYHDETGG